jgi:uncharacterized protein (UPF0333 family)
MYCVSKKNQIILYSLIFLVVILVVVGFILPLQMMLQQQIARGTPSNNQDHFNNNNNNYRQQSNNIAVLMSANLSIRDDNNNFTSIFDGKSLEGWDMTGEGRFVIVREDKALQSEGGTGLLWYTKKKYDDFVLKLEWKVSKEGDNSGVFVRFPDPDGNPSIAFKEGYEIQIDDKANDAIHQTGAIYDFAAPSKKIVSKPVGQWNTMEIRVINQSYNVMINGEDMTEFTGDRLTEGYIGLQAHDDKSKVSFRNIMIKEVKP